MWIEDEKQVMELRETYPEGTRIILDQMQGETQMECDMSGTVQYVDDAGQIHVQWENGSTLALIPGVDQFRKAEKQKEKLDRAISAPEPKK